MTIHAVKTAQRSSILEIMSQARDLGFRHNFRLKGNQLVCSETGNFYEPCQLGIEASFRYEGDSDPDDSSVLYVLRACDGTGGTIMDSFGAKGSSELAELLTRISDNRDCSLLMQNLPANKTIAIKVVPKNVTQSI